MTPAAEHHALSAINLAIDSLPESSQEAIRAGVAIALALPRAVVEVAAVLAHGGKKRGIGAGERDGQTALDHIYALDRHAGRAVPDIGGPVLTIDADSGRPHAAHASARGMLAIEAAT